MYVLAVGAAAFIFTPIKFIIVRMTTCDNEYDNDSPAEGKLIFSNFFKCFFEVNKLSLIESLMFVFLDNNMNNIKTPINLDITDPQATAVVFGSFNIYRKTAFKITFIILNDNETINP